MTGKRGGGIRKYTGGGRSKVFLSVVSVKATGEEQAGAGERKQMDLEDRVNYKK